MVDISSGLAQNLANSLKNVGGCSREVAGSWAERQFMTSRSTSSLGGKFWSRSSLVTGGGEPTIKMERGPSPGSGSTGSSSSSSSSSSLSSKFLTSESYKSQHVADQQKETFTSRSTAVQWEEPV